MFYCLKVLFSAIFEKRVTDRRTDGRTDGRTDKASYRDAWTHLKTIIGKSVKDGLISIKGADLTINKYIGRFDNDVTVEGIRQFITDQGVSVVEIDQLDTKHTRFKSFRLRIKRSQLDLVENEEF